MSTRVFESWVEYLANARSMRAPMVLGGDAPARVSGSGTMQQVIIFQPCHVKADGTAIVSNVVVDTCSWLLFCRACNAVKPTATTNHAHCVGHTTVTSPQCIVSVLFSKALVLTHELTPEKDFDMYLGRRLAPVRPLLSYGRSAKAFPKVEARQAVYWWWKDY